MSTVLDAFLRSWPSDPLLVAVLCLTAAVYLRGWLVLRRRDARRWFAAQPVSFLGGLAAIFLALASPIEPFSFLFLQVHMLQHLLLMMAAPALLWLGAPLFPLLRGLPGPARKYWVTPFFRSPAVRRFAGRVSHPVAAGLLYVGATWLWHLPPLYELAIRSGGWHYLQHATFLVTGLLFWYPVVRPYPARPRWPLWLLAPYLLLADVQNTLLSALLAFSDRVLYPHYAQAPRLDGLSALDDQAAAGALMWIPGSLAFLIPLFWIATRALLGRTERPRARRSAPGKRPVPAASGGKVPLPLVDASSAGSPAPAESWDLLRVPGLGRFLRWRQARLCLQIPLLLLAAILIYDGLTGPQAAPMNLAGVLPWIHWRGLLIIGLLAVGNVFCLACPFMAPRLLARRLFPQRFAWPHWLRNKWLAVLLVLLFLWAYEIFALWDSPWWTAWIAIGYFVAALLVDSLFRDAAFCKYVCPIGQFNFVQSLVSPWEVKAREAKICASCRTKDCIGGRVGSQGSGVSGQRSGGGQRFGDADGGLRGCELHLFVPRKASNMDCTFCLDCVHACPHDNIGIVLGVPTRELWHDRALSRLGRLGGRPDLAALVLVLVFGAFANAAGMVAPVADWQDNLQQQWGLASAFWPISVYYVLGLLVLPLLCVGFAAALSRWWGGAGGGWLETATRYVYALVPLGFAMWLSHYGFHLLTSYETALPAAQRFAGDLGGNLGAPDWTYACCGTVMPWLPRLEILILDAGLLASLYTGYRLARASARDGLHALRTLTPWAALIGLLFALGVWIVLQPMQMRGTLM